MNNDLAQSAIAAAMKGNWKTALDTNLQMLKVEPDNTDTLNRLARAQAELGDMINARKTSQAVLKLDPFNNIATKSLIKWKSLKKGDVNSGPPSSLQNFLEEPGKTKICSLLFLGSPKVIAKLDCGDEVKLDTHSHRVSITTFDNKYIGRLPDDLSARLKKFISLENEYCVIIKSTDQNDVKVFIKETKRGKKSINTPSFITEKKIDYVTFTPPEMVHDKSEIRITPEDEEN